MSDTTILLCILGVVIGYPIGIIIALLIEWFRG